MDTPSAKPTIAASKALDVRRSIRAFKLSRALALVVVGLAASSASDVEEDSVVEVQNPVFPSPKVHFVPMERGRLFTRADVAPYFSGPAGKEAQGAFAQARYGDAARLFRALPSTPPSRFMTALSLFKAEDFAAAAPLFVALESEGHALADRSALFAGQCFEKLEKPTEALVHFARVSERSRQAVDAALGRARAHRALKQFREADEAATPLAARPAPAWGRDVGAEALFELFETARARGHVAQQRAWALQLWGSHPQSPWARRMEGELGDSSSIPVEHRVARGEALVEAHQNAAGLTLLEKAATTLKFPDPLACRAHFMWGKALRKLRRHAQAVEVLAPMARACPLGEGVARALYTLGFSQSVVKGPARESYRRLSTEMPDHPFADDALFFIAELDLKDDRVEDALANLSTLVERYPNGDFCAEALFKKFWILFRAGRLDEASAALATIDQRYVAAEESFDRERARYWRARLAQLGGEHRVAIDMFRALAFEHPATYYGLLSRQRTLALDPTLGPALTLESAASNDRVDPFPMHLGPLENEPLFHSAVELLRLGLGEWVPLEILAIDRSGLPEESVRVLVHLLSLSGDAKAAQGLARQWLRRDLSGRISAQRRPLWEIAYPLAFRDEVMRAAKLAPGALDANLLQALMREESALDPNALSWAGAMGLTQLMPPTAAMVAAQLGLPKPSKEQILEPELNVRLGGAYLGGLLKRFSGEKAYAVASYNAGPGAVDRWRAHTPNEDVDVWAEEIPLSETRGYVKRVLRSYNTYQLLYPTDAGR